MNSEEQLLQKLMISKKIMEKHNDIGRGNGTPQVNINTPTVENFQPIQGNYNIPNGLLQEDFKIPSKNQAPIEDRIMNSKLPDEIKKLMLEHPIEQPTSMNGSAVLSDDLVEKASRLMGTSKQTQINENVTQQVNNKNNSNFDINELKYMMKDIIRETVEDVLKENGLLVETSTRSNEVFKFRVGQHIFEGKVTNIKKISK
jgi:hypothetical protein